MSKYWAVNPLHRTIQRVQTNLKTHGFPHEISPEHRGNALPSHHMSKAKLYCLLADRRAAGFEQKNSQGTFFEKSFSFHLGNWVNSDKCAKPLQTFNIFH